MATVCIKKLFLTCLLAKVLIIGYSSAAPLHVRITSQPSAPNGTFSGVVDAADFSDPTPNPCFRNSSCYFAAFVNSKSWGAVGREGYHTVDDSNTALRREAVINAATIGEAARNLRDKGLLFLDMQDYLPASKGGDPTFCVYAADGNARQKAGTLLSNCADAPTPPVDCQITSGDIDLDWGTQTLNHDMGLRQQTVTLNCSSPTRVRLTVSGEFITLSGDSTQRALINLGDGWNGTRILDVNGNKSIDLQAKLQGVGSKIGSFKGSAPLIMNIE